MDAGRYIKIMKGREEARKSRQESKETCVAQKAGEEIIAQNGCLKTSDASVKK